MSFMASIKSLLQKSVSLYGIVNKIAQFSVLYKTFLISYNYLIAKTTKKLQ